MSKPLEGTGMEPYYLFLILLVIYIAILAGIGLLASRGQRSMTDFWLAGRELGTIPLGFSWAASWITASALFLATGLFLLIGVGSIWIWVFPNMMALLIIVIIAGRIKNIPALTQPELMEIRYDSTIRAPVALAIAIMMILFSVTDFIGFKIVAGTFFGMDPVYAVLIMAASVAFYVSVGGFRAVVQTDIPQFLLLAGLAIFVALLALYLPWQQGISLAATVQALNADWWNLFILGGVSGALVFQLALLPGWVAEQDPWQKIWAARDLKSARRGLIMGASLLALIYLCCFLTAIGLNALYPVPNGEIEAEMLYLKFISDSVPPTLVALLALGFAAASMSCTDTFATSGASCISRDIIQRHLYPSATMKEMMILNRILVVVMIAISAAISLKVESIMDTVIMATVIGTTSYFFPIIGGLYWKRATKWGALAALIVGGGTEILLITYELFWVNQPLDSLSPYLTEHGVLVGLALSALFFVGISLITKPTESIRLAPFFSDVAEEIFKGKMPTINKGSARYTEILGKIEERVAGDRAHLSLYVNLTPVKADGAVMPGVLNWDRFVEKLKTMYPSWYTPMGGQVAYRLSQADMLACVKMVRGDHLQIWLSAEPELDQVDREKDELVLGFGEIEDVLLEFGLSPFP
ncbi:MAG: sodium:solute symporter family protein [Methanotrichaceae archaeon]|nr:sodium:solute symporter family protein [Methanotrichaceae archaeon]